MSHLQSAPASLAGRLHEFAGQPLHAALPAAALNVPPAHAAQSPPSAPVKPGRHRQALASVLPEGEDENGGHAVAWSRAPAQYVFGAHAAQTCCVDVETTSESKSAPRSAPQCARGATVRQRDMTYLSNIQNMRLADVQSV